MVPNLIEDPAEMRKTSKINPPFKGMIQSSAIFMVVAVSAERYRAVCHPMSKRQAQCPI
jgi:hypothetical protein